MITGISIENFKGIRERVELKLKPITLLFGPNSAGKSTILHALHYAREVFERRNLDADQTLTGGKYVDLGGFHQLVHNHNDSSPVRIGFELDLESVDVPDFETPLPAGAPIEHPDSFVGSIKSASLEFEIRWNAKEAYPFVRDYSVNINGTHLGRIQTTAGRKSVYLDFEPNHHVMVLADSHHCIENWLDGSATDSGLARLWAFAFDKEPKQVSLGYQTDSLPEWGKQLSIDWHLTHDGLNGIRRRGELLGAVDWIEQTLSQVMVGPGQVVRDILLDLRYLGPLRETPARNFAPPRFPDPARWASGLGAWDRLCAADSKFIGMVNQWLSDPEYLDTGYGIDSKTYKELDLADPLMLKLLTGRAFDDVDQDASLNWDKFPTRSRLVIRPNRNGLELDPHDVGIGISQLVPVVVTALADSNHTIAIEQPELHLHPRLQANLGDLLVTAALGEQKHRVIVETHSELIPLRIMRRIRDTVSGRLPQHLPQVTADDVAIYYVEPVGSACVVHQLELGEEGDLLDPWPEGFFEEGFRERFPDGQL